jgi:negative regulator of genetic competence, sporulation and motility
MSDDLVVPAAPCWLQVASLKQKLVVVLNKTKNDNQLIAALREELAAATRKPSVAG